MAQTTATPVITGAVAWLTYLAPTAGSRLPPDARYTRTCDHFNVGTCSWKETYCRYPHVCCLCGTRGHGYNRCPLRVPLAPGYQVTGGPSQGEKIRTGISRPDTYSSSYEPPILCPKKHCTNRQDLRSYQALQQHMNTVHLNNDLFWCYVCGEIGPVMLGGIAYHVMVCHREADRASIMANIVKNLRARGGVDYWIPEVAEAITGLGVGITSDEGVGLG